MPRDLTLAQQSLVDAASTKPIIIAEIAHSGISELLSATDRVVYEGRVFSAGGFKLVGIRNAQSATVSLPFTTARVQQVQSGSWRGGVLKVWAILADPSIPADYTAVDAILMLDGEIVSSQYSGESVQVQATHVLAGSRVSPRHTYNLVVADPPAAGASITWEGETLVLEPRR